MKKQKIKLRMDEDNQLSFALSIEGYSSDPTLSSKPKVRFILEGKGMGFVLPAQFENGEVSVNLPSSNLYEENQEYEGKLEVLLGSRYFAPAELTVQFEKPLKVEARVKGTILEEEAPAVVATVRRSKPETLKEAPRPKKVPEEKIDVGEEIEALKNLVKKEEEKRMLITLLHEERQKAKQLALEAKQKERPPEIERFKRALKDSFKKED